MIVPVVGVGATDFWMLKYTSYVVNVAKLFT